MRGFSREEQSGEGVGAVHFEAWGLLDSQVLHVCPFNGRLLSKIQNSQGSGLCLFPQEDVCHVRECQRTGF